MKVFLKKSAFPILIFFIVLFIFLSHYKFDAYLVGWDNVFPEFNFGLNLKRDFFAIWQEYRGLGVVDGMSHASLVVQDTIRLILSFFMPVSLIRWIYIFSLLFLGGLGMFRLLKKIISSGIISFLGAFFYMFNLGSIIQFFLPLEVFIVHFAFLPWLILYCLNFLKTGRKKELLLVFIISFLASPQAHVPTVFIAYLFAISLLVFTHLLHSRFKLFKRCLVLFCFILLANAFWFVPFVSTNIKNSSVVSNTKAFQMASNDIFYRNNKYGNFADVALIKGFPLEFKYLDYKTGLSHIMMWPWVNHIRTPFFYIPAWTFFLLALLGLYKSLKSRSLPLISSAVIFLFSFFMLGTDTPIIGLLSQFLRKYIPLFNVIFRFTFTKFSIIYVFSYSVMFVSGLDWILNSIKKGKNILIIFISCLLFSYTLPAFQGHFLYENLAVKIPQEYFEVFNFFNKQKQDERIAILPIPWYWAWAQPKWGTINSGFIWYGLSQPITDLAFNPWGNENENFYWELEKAIYTENTTLLQKILNKYNIRWIYLDKNIVKNTGEKITYEDYEELLSKTKNIKLAQKFSSIYIYHVSNEEFNSSITVKQNLPSINPSYKCDDYDLAYESYGNYLSNSNSLIYFPFRSLFSGKSPKDIEFSVDEDENFLYFKAELPTVVSNWKFEKNSPLDQEFILYNEQNKPKKYQAQISINNNALTVSINKKTTQVFNGKNNLSLLNQKSVKSLKNGLGITSIGSSNYIRADLPEISLRYGYLYRIKTINSNKRGFLIDFNNNTTKKNDLETYLDNDGQEHDYYFITSPRGYYDQGYTIYFNNLSEGNEVVTNILEEVTAYQIPYYFLKNIRLVSPNYFNSVNSRNQLTTLEVNHPNPSYYSAVVKNVGESSIIYLSQSYNSGWIAISEGKILDHVKVNNWANGWTLRSENSGATESQGQKVIIIFWPQYLQFLGFGLLILGFLFIIFKYEPFTPSDTQS